MMLVHAVFIAALIASVAPRWRRWPLALPVAAIAIAMAVVATNVRSAYALITIIGAPSITTIAILVNRATRRCSGATLFSTRERTTILSFLAVAAFVVYPGVLGYANFFDVYRLGFLAGAPVALALIGILLLLLRQHRVAVVVLIALIALDLRLLPSVNVIDYVVDPLGGIAAIVWAIARGVRLAMNRMRGVESSVPLVARTH